MAEPLPENARMAAALREAADLLEKREANPFRVAAYRRGAGTVERLPEKVSELLAREGTEGLVRLPQVGPAIAHANRS